MIQAEHLWLAVEPVDMPLGIDGLSLKVRKRRGVRSVTARGSRGPIVWVAVFDKQPLRPIGANSASKVVQRQQCGELRSPRWQALNDRLGRPRDARAHT